MQDSNQVKLKLTKDKLKNVQKNINIIFKCFLISIGFCFMFVSFQFNVFLFDTMFNNMKYVIYIISLLIIAGEIGGYIGILSSLKNKQYLSLIISIFIFIISFVINISASTACMINIENNISNNLLKNSKLTQQKEEKDQVINDFINSVSEDIKKNKKEITNEEINSHPKVEKQQAEVDKYHPILYKTKRNKAKEELIKIKIEVKEELEKNMKETNVSDDTINKVTDIIKNEKENKEENIVTYAEKTTKGLNGLMVKILNLFGKELNNKSYEKLSFIVSVFLSIGLELIMTYLSTMLTTIISENSTKVRKKEFSLDEYLKTRKIKKEMKMSDIVKDIETKYKKTFSTHQLGKMLKEKGVIPVKKIRGYNIYEI